MKAIARQADSKVLIGGDFSSVGGIVRPLLARLLDDPPTPTTVHFDSPSYSAVENGSAAMIAVTRTGNTSGIATVDYATSDAPHRRTVHTAGRARDFPHRLNDQYFQIPSSTSARQPDETSTSLSNRPGSVGTPSTVPISMMPRCGCVIKHLSKPR